MNKYVVETTETTYTTYTVVAKSAEDAKKMVREGTWYTNEPDSVVTPAVEITHVEKIE